jgi:hypothetical protein
VRKFWIQHLLMRSPKGHIGWRLIEMTVHFF